MLRLKKGVKLHDLSTQILLALQVAGGLYDKQGQDCIVTSLNDGNHRMNSLHNIGHACDLRVHNLHMQPEELRNFALEIQDYLGGVGGSYDVIAENLGTEQAHIHIEYQPHWAAD
jgi:hypothetical protein